MSDMTWWRTSCRRPRMPTRRAGRRRLLDGITQSALPVRRLRSRRPARCRSGRRALRGRRWWVTGLLFPAVEEQAADQQEDDRSGEGDDDLVEDRRADVDRDVQLLSEPAADDRADDADHDVHQPAAALAEHDPARQEPGDKSDYEVDDYVPEAHSRYLSARHPISRRLNFGENCRHAH